MQFDFDQSYKLMFVEPVRAIEAPFKKLRKLIEYCEQGETRSGDSP